jgi:electron transfer flavoprotein beta subunit
MLTGSAMKILVTAKRVPDPELKLKFKGTALDLTGANYVLNPFDEYAIEAALRLTEDKHNAPDRKGEVVVVSLGPKDAQQQVRQALAMGATRGLLLAGDDETLDGEIVARALTKVVEREKPDVVILGKQAVDGDDNQVAQLLAGYLGWPQATFASTVNLAADGKSITVGREVDAGVETKKVPLPCVVSVDLRIIAPKAVINAGLNAQYEAPEGPRYASLKGIMAAKKKELKEETLEALGVNASARVKTLSAEAPPARKGGIKVGSVDELMQKLHNEAKVL